ncbi:D8Ertd354e protein [Zea mays]|uniref:D8Ertd354e protein n=1 Tax=Zea mays TaxID=4577 RepID=A0A1D6LL51_MAIZE|nr:D8Ertd354e protein [Zea mays]
MESRVQGHHRMFWALQYSCTNRAYVHNSSSLHMTASFFSLLDSFHFCPLGFKSAYPSIFFSFFNHIGLPDLGNTTSSLLSTCCHVVLELWYNWSWVKATWSLEVVGELSS